MFELIAFYTFSALTIVAFTMTVMAKNALFSMSALGAGMIFISGFFFLLDADFLGIVQIIVYTGAVMALYAFGMMFFDVSKDIKEANRSPKVVFLLSGLVALLVVVIFTAPLLSDKVQALATVSAELNNVQAVGVVLFTKYLVPFEVAAVMLLVAMIAGIVLANKDMEDSLTLKLDDEILDTKDIK